MASDPTRGSRHDFPSGRPGRTLLFSCTQHSVEWQEFLMGGGVGHNFHIVFKRIFFQQN